MNAKERQQRGSGISRRTILLATGTGLVGTVTRSLPAADAAPLEVTPADTTLMNEHGVLLRLLLVYEEAIGQLDTRFSTAVAALERAADLVHQLIENFHEALEEGYVFPVLRSRGQLTGTIDTLLTQHARGRLITQLLLAEARPASLGTGAGRQRVTAAVRAFTRMYLPHEAREDTIVFPTYRATCSPAQLQADGESFAELETQAFGSTALATVVDWVAEVERTLGFYDLQRFTAPAVTPLPVPMT